MNKGVELGLGVIFVSFIDILLFIVNTNTSSKRKRAKKGSLPGPWEDSLALLGQQVAHSVSHLWQLFLFLLLPPQVYSQNSGN